jgi:polyisoprenyl-phosphate glycosyltransferase
MADYLSYINLSKGDRLDKSISLDIIIPFFNEEKVLDLLISNLKNVFSPENLHKHNIKSVRYLMVDDGSADESANIVCNYISQGFPAILYRLSRNFGHQNAISAGINHADSDVVAIIDADLQDPPEIILEMILKWRKGCDVVYGVRKKRKENFLKVFSYWLFYRFLSFLSEIHIPLDSGDFSLLDRKVIHAMRNLPETLRHPRILRAWVGFRQEGCEYERTARKVGHTKYTFSKLYKLATDGIASASIRPLRISQFFTNIYLGLLIIIGVILVLKYSFFVNTKNELAIWFLICYALIALGSFVQILCIYILSSYIGRTYLETKQRPPYILLEVIKNEALLKTNKDELET